MNPFQSIANYLDNDLYRWETDLERKRRYDEMYPMGDAHLGEWDQLARARVRRNLAPGFQHWDEGAEDTSLVPGFQHWDKGVQDTGPAGYDAGVQENILKKTIVETPEGTTTTVKTAPRPTPSPVDSSRNSAHVQSMLDRHYQYNRGEPDLPVSWSIPPIASGARGFTPPPVSNVEPNLRTQFPAPPTPYPDAGGMDYQRRSINEIRGDIQAEQFNQARAARARQVHPSVSGRFYEGPQGRPMFDPNIVGPAAAHTRALQSVATQQPMPYTGGNVSGVPTPPMPVQPNLGPRITRGGITGQEQHRISRRPQYGNQAYRSWTLPELSLTEQRPSIYSREHDRGGVSMDVDYPTPPISGDAYTDAIVDFVGRDAERDETGMKDWYSQMAREAIRKFNGLPADGSVTPVYKRKASGPSKRTMNKGSKSKSKKKQRGRGRRY